MFYLNKIISIEGLSGYIFGFINKLQIAVIYSLISSFLTHSMMLRVVAILYDQRLKLWRYIVAGIICALAYIFPILIAESFYNPMLFSVSLAEILTICPPYLIVVYYFVIAYILKINKSRCLLIVSKFYYMAIISVLFFYVLLAFCSTVLKVELYQEAFILFLVHVLSTITAYIVTYTLAYYIKKRCMWFENFVQVQDKKIYKRLMVYTMQDTGIFLLMTVGVKIAGNEALNFLTACIFFLVCIGICISFFIYRFSSDRIAMNKIAVENKNLHIASLLASIHKFRMVKHDINNMMQVYNGYFAIGDYVGLRKYHESVYKMAADANDGIELHAIMEQNNELYTVLRRKMQEASERKLNLRISCKADTSSITLEPLELAYIVGVLLDHAIEETAKTDKRIIHFSLEPKENKVLISISSPTAYEVDVKQLWTKDFTDKQNYSESGLHELWNMITNSGNCSLEAASFNHTITFYLEVPCFIDERK